MKLSAAQRIRLTAAKPQNHRFQIQLQGVTAEMYLYAPQSVSVKFSAIPCFGSSRRDFKIPAISMSAIEVSAHIPAAPIFLPEGPWKQVDLLHDAVFVLLFAFFCAISFSCFFNIDQDL